MFIECDCSVDADEYMVSWVSGWLVADSRPPIWCYECGRWIKPGEIYHEGSGIMPDNITDSEYYDDHDELSEEDELNCESFDTCLGCMFIQARFCPGGYILGGLAEAVQECVGFYYPRDDDEDDDDDE